MADGLVVARRQPPDLPHNLEVPGRKGRLTIQVVPNQLPVAPGPVEA